MICGPVVLTIGIGVCQIVHIFHQRQEVQMSDLKGTAVVTGATGGVGALFAARLTEPGYDLFLVGRRQKTGGLS